MMCWCCALALALAQAQGPAPQEGLFETLVKGFAALVVLAALGGAMGRR